MKSLKRSRRRIDECVMVNGIVEDDGNTLAIWSTISLCQRPTRQADPVVNTGTAVGSYRTMTDVQWFWQYVVRGGQETRAPQLLAVPVPSYPVDRRATMRGLSWMASVATMLGVSLVSPNVGRAKVMNTGALFQSAVQLGGVEAWFRIPDRGQLAGLGGEAAMRQTLSGSAQSFNSAFSRPPGVRVPDSFTHGDLSAWRQGLERLVRSNTERGDPGHLIVWKLGHRCGQLFMYEAWGRNKRVLQVLYVEIGELLQRTDLRDGPPSGTKQIHRLGAQIEAAARSGDLATCKPSPVTQLVYCRFCNLARMVVVRDTAPTRQPSATSARVQYDERDHSDTHHRGIMCLGATWNTDTYERRATAV